MKKIVKFPAHIFLLFAIVFFGTLSLAYAQEPDETGPDNTVTPQTEQGDTVTLPAEQGDPDTLPTESDNTADTQIEPSDTVTTSQEAEETPLLASDQLELTLEELGYGEREFNRDEATRYYTINIPENFELSPTSSYLELHTRHFPPSPDKPSVIRVVMNGRLLTTFPLAASNAVSNVVRINLPQETFTAGSNSMRIDLDTSETCEEGGALVDFIVDDSSVFGFGYEQQPYPTDLGLYPYPFAETGFSRVPVTIVLPDDPSSQTLAAAATVAAGLGRASEGMIEVNTVLASDLTPDIRNEHHLIVIGQPDNNDLLADLSLPVAINSQNLKPGYGIIQEVVSPWNDLRLVLVVSGPDEKGVLKASQALNRQVNFLGMRGPVAIVIDLLPLPDEETTQSDVNSMTFASLGYTDRTAYGAGHQDFSYDFFLPRGWQLEEQPYFVLKIAHADILDAAESVANVRLNGVPIGSALLEQDNGINGELTLQMPRRLLKTGRNSLNIGVEMSLPNGDLCADKGDQRAWTTVSSDSEIFLPYSSLDVAPDLSLFPYPFIQNPGLDQTVLVLADNPSTIAINELMRLAVQLGSPLPNQDIVINVAYASEVDKAMQADHHFIVLGRPTVNTLLAEVNDQLPQPFQANSDFLKPMVIDSVAFMPDPNRDAGLLELTASPWGDSYTLLAITGTTDQGVALAMQALLENGDELNGNLAVVEPSLDPFSDEPNQISTYSIDTRPPAQVDDEEAHLDPATLDENLALYAQLWWR
ncbi:MAG TPA: cellulose biosynthesis cyclic di-GMP-binding regulatory protein BcsB [Anaerolineae bacterium]|nr:cellulose biosynthesis cyclic di-GMP-binding regulatory protein BcsB [Anaerolineaceae bacterium]HRV95381.1 cellulose biosynthesis cyclic di-GMP-binding regulatory protein BcsB [Anaerolineae bacterium]